MIVISDEVRARLLPDEAARFDRRPAGSHTREAKWWCERLASVRRDLDDVPSMKQNIAQHVASNAKIDEVLLGAGVQGGTLAERVERLALKMHMLERDSKKG